MSHSGEEAPRIMMVEHNGISFPVELVVDDSPATLAHWRRMPALLGQLVEKHRQEYGEEDGR